MSKFPRDQKARDRIASDLDCSFLVEAGAGSGKTSSLIDRMVAIITAGRARPEELAAVTFTRKAAGELRERFQEGLEKALETGGKLEAQRAAGALEDIEKVFVGTIHSFCAMILRERPVEAGLDPGFTELDEEEDLRLISRAWDRYLLYLQAEKPEILDQLDKLDIRVGELEKQFVSVVNFPEVELVTENVPYPGDLLEKARVEMHRYLDKMEILLPSEEPVDGWDTLQHRVRMGLRWRERFSLEGDRIFTRLLRNMEAKSSRVTLKRWPTNEIGREAKAIEEEFREKVIAPTLLEWYRHCHQPVVRFLREAGAFYTRMKRKENFLNYQDLLVETVALLRDNSEVRRYFQEKFSSLLVDEFQDTDPLQAEIIMYLAGDRPDEKDWTLIKPRPGALFVVGDPKQSIYRFRRADIDIYTRVRDQIKASGGEVLHLSTNFRSTKPLVDWANETFSPIMGSEKPPYQAEYGHMDYFNSSLGKGDSGVRILPTEKVYRNLSEVICSQEAEKIANYIGKALRDEKYIESEGRKVCPEDFLIIIPYKKNMSCYARALEQAGIPFSLSGGGEMGTCEELVELLDVFKALADPNNPVPLLAALRGIYFGISDEEIYQFKSLGGYFSFLSPVPEGAGTEIKKAWEKMQDFYKLTRQFSPTVAMARIAEDLGAIPLALSASLGRSRAGYILQALELVQKKEKSGETGFASNVDFLEELLQGRVEEEIDPEGGLAGVRVMNLHKAKGLEAPVVFLANPAHNPSFPPEFHVTREQKVARGYLEIKDQKGTIGLPPNWDFYREEEKKYLHAEAKRLLYVAATRAKELLVVSIYRGKEDNSFWYPLNSFLAGARELEECEFKVEKKETRKGIEPLHRDEFFQKLEQQKESVSQSSYRRETVTKIAETGEYPRRTREKGRGTAWGNVIHRALEKTFGEKLPPDGYLVQLLDEEGVDLERLSQVRAQLKKVLETSIWARVKKAQEVIREANFGVKKGDLYLTGVADLAFREGDGWVIVDYKSDLVEGDQHLQELIAYYRPQVDIYSRYWEELTGFRVKELGLLFTEVPTYYSWVKSGGEGK